MERRRISRLDNRSNSLDNEDLTSSYDEEPDMPYNPFSDEGHVNQAVVICEKESFLVKALIRNLNENGYEGVYSTSTVQEVGNHQEEADIYILYKDELLESDVDLIVYLKDNGIAEGKLVVLIGTEEDYKLMTKVIPKEMLSAWVTRPFDMKELMDKLNTLSEQKKEGLNKRSVLVVDDDLTFLKTVEGWLKDKYRVTIVNSGMQAIKWLAKHSTDLILLDYEMPIATGENVYEMLRSEVGTNDIPIMFLTGKNDRESITRLLKLKPERYLLKPIGRVALLSELQQFFDKQRK